MQETYDLAVIGGGTAGLSAAFFAANRGLKTIVIEASAKLGGTLNWAAGFISAAGTSLQRSRNIADDPDQHFNDVMRISKGTADPVFVRKAVDLAPETIEWLLKHRYDIDPACPSNVLNHEPYSVERTCWGRNRAKSILAVLLAQLEALGSRQPRIEMMTEATRLLQSSDSAVEGVEVRMPNGSLKRVRARKVILTSGGFAGNPKMYERITGKPLYGPLPDVATGSGFDVALAAGAVWRESPYLMASVGGIEEAPGTQRVNWYERPQLTPQLRAPWEIFVQRDGTRFMREDEPSIDVREHALLKVPDSTFWIVFDSCIAREAPPLFPAWDRCKWEQMLAGHHAFLQADSVEDLAVKAGINPEALARTVARYNDGVERNSDALGRVSLPATIGHGPFYAIKNHAVVIKTHWGIRVSPELEVLTADDRPIPNLYAAGEVLGGSLLSGNSYVTGMSITPALSFGRWLGSTLQ
jgi:fumarate reductase flavoprotein subunit